MKCSLGIFFLVPFFIAGSADELEVVNIVPKGKVHFAKVGDPLSIECYILLSDNDELSLKWTTPTRDGVDISARSDLQADHPKVLKLLNIKSLKQEHFGHYTCSYKSSSASFHLYAEGPQSGANFSYEGHKSSFVLACNITDTDFQEKVVGIEWLKNDTLVTKLDDSERFIQKNNTLEIAKARRSDADLYIARFTFASNSIHDCEVPFNAPPFLIPFDKSKNVIEGNDLIIHCSVLGYPREEVVWLKDNKVLNPADDTRMVLDPWNDYNNASLLIKDATFEDAGEYSCKIHSDFFNQTVTASLIVRVKDRLAALWPFIGIVCELLILFAIIFIYEKRRPKQPETEVNNVQDVDGSAAPATREGLRNRNTQSDNPSA